MIIKIKEEIMAFVNRIDGQFLSGVIIRFHFIFRLDFHFKYQVSFDCKLNLFSAKN